MLKVTLKLRKLGKTGWYYNSSQICSETIKNYSVTGRVTGIKYYYQVRILKEVLKVRKLGKIKWQIANFFQHYQK